MRRRTIRFLILAVAVPVVGRLVTRAGEKLEATRGPSLLSGSLRHGGARLGRWRRRGRITVR